MTFEIPNDQITKLQFSLREQANLPSYDPYNPSLPALPSSLDSISAVDSPRRCCHSCKAPLLHHSNSLLCIFCGKRPTQTPPQPINFHSTSGYQSLLHSLNVNGSEIVGESLDGNESNNERKEKFALSDILGFEIRWKDPEIEEFESGPLNLALNNDFSAGSKQDSVSTRSDGTSEVKKGIEFGSSHADFQSANSIADHGAVSSRSFDHFVSSSKDMTSSSTSGDPAQISVSNAQDVAQGSSDQTSEKGGDSFTGLEAGSESTSIFQNSP